MSTSRTPRDSSWRSELTRTLLNFLLDNPDSAYAGSRSLDLPFVCTVEYRDFVIKLLRGEYAGVDLEELAEVSHIPLGLLQRWLEGP